jgi:hypothetical protein
VAASLQCARRAVQNARGLVRQLLTESLLLATIGGALAIWGTSALSTAAAGMLLPNQRLTIDLPVLGFACAASLPAGLAFDLVPALHDGAFNHQFRSRRHSPSTPFLQAWL